MAAPLAKAALLAATALALAACSGSGVSGGSGAAGGRTAADCEPSLEFVDGEFSDAGGGIDVGFVYEAKARDSAWSFAHDQGRLSVEANISADTFVDAGIGSESLEYRLTASTQINLYSADVVISPSSAFTEAIDELAVQFPEVTFLGGGHADPTLPNVGRFSARIYQPFYLAGIAAGSLRGVERIGFVGAHPIAPVIRAVNAFTLGVREVNPAATVEVRFTGGWIDPDGEAAAARELVAAGVDLLAQYQDTPTVGRVAEREGVRWVSHHVNMCHFAPNAYVTGPVWDWGVYYRRTIAAVANDAFVPDTYWGGMDDDAVALAPLSPDVPDSARQLIQRRSIQMVSRQWDVFTGPIANQAGEVVVPDGTMLTQEQLLNMDFFVEGVIGDPSG